MTDFRRLMAGLVLFFVLAIAAISALSVGTDKVQDASRAAGTYVSCNLALCEQTGQHTK